MEKFLEGTNFTNCLSAWSGEVPGCGGSHCRISVYKSKKSPGNHVIEAHQVTRGDGDGFVFGAFYNDLKNAFLDP